MTQGPPASPRSRTFQEMHDMLRNDTFRNPAEMCIRAHASAYAFSDQAHFKALASGVIANNWMDIDAIMSAVVTDPEGSGALDGDDDELSRLVDKVWAMVALARYPQLAGVQVNYPPEVLVDSRTGRVMELPVGLVPRVGAPPEHAQEPVPEPEPQPSLAPESMPDVSGRGPRG